MSNPAAKHGRPLSALLRELYERDAERISVAELTDHFGGRAMGALLLVFGIACMLPLPPGGTTIFGIPLLLLAPQLLLGKPAPWLPVAVRRKSVAVSDLRAGLPRAVRILQRIEAVSKPRLAFLFVSLGQRLIGAVCTVLAFVLILPIPLGNILPATAVTVLSLSLVLRDGLLALFGYLLALTSAGVLVLAAHLVIAALQQIWSVVSPA
jgi:hypothetical protein